MSILMRAGEINKRPVVTFGGEDIAEIKDIVYGANGGRVEGFTLNSRSFFGPTLKTSLPWSSVAALGPDAVMVKDADALVPTQELLEAARSAGTDGPGGGNILGSEVMTDDGSSLGTVVDVIIEVADDPGEEADVVGYEIEPSQGMGATGRLLIPLPDTLAASGQHLIVPAAAREFVGQDLAGFGAAVHAFRARFENQLQGQHGSSGPADQNRPKTDDGPRYVPTPPTRNDQQYGDQQYGDQQRGGQPQGGHQHHDGYQHGEPQQHREQQRPPQQYGEQQYGEQRYGEQRPPQQYGEPNPSRQQGQQYPPQQYTERPPQHNDSYPPQGQQYLPQQGQQYPPQYGEQQYGEQHPPQQYGEPDPSRQQGQQYPPQQYGEQPAPGERRPPQYREPDDQSPPGQQPPPGHRPPPGYEGSQR